MIFARFLPSLSGSEARELAAYVRKPSTQKALAALTSACPCIAGAVWCTCPARAKLTEADLAVLMPLAVAFGRGVAVSVD
jgi:hypothetical protein